MTSCPADGCTADVYTIVEGGRFNPTSTKGTDCSHRVTGCSVCGAAVLERNATTWIWTYKQKMYGQAKQKRSRTVCDDCDADDYTPPHAQRTQEVSA